MSLLNTSINKTTNTEQALTEIEALGLASQHDLANGHASQELAPSQERIIQSLPLLWKQAAGQKSRHAELCFKDAFRKLAMTPSLTNYENFKICPTASNSIDTVATWLAEKQLKTALIEPTFDNLYLILKRRGVQLSSFPEAILYGEGNDFDLFKDVDAIFLVNPNNPTGKVLTKAQFTHIVEWCAVNQKVLVLDNTFRFFVPQTYDSYEILLDSGVTFLSIEDTGKVWPTQEIKASLLITSSNVIKEIDIIYDEIFLCHSNFALGILSQFLLDAHERGLDKAIWQGVAERRKKFRAAISGSPLMINPGSIESTISVEWVMIQHKFENDMHLAEFFKDRNLVMLPGRQFFWNSKGADSVTQFVRFALLKPEQEFNSAIDVLVKELGRLN